MSSSQQLSSLFRHSKALVTSGHRHTPRPTGPHSSVGFRDFLLGNSRKTGLLVRLFYPSSSSLPTDPKQWAKWLPHEGYEKGLGDVAGVRSRVISALARAVNPLDNVRVPVVENGALLLPSADRYPLLVFSHGLGAYRSVYSTICTEFASRGFVVAAVEHRDNSAAMSFYYRSKRGNDLSESDEQNYNPKDYGISQYKPPRPLEPISVDSERELVWIRHQYVSLIDHSPAALQFRHAQVKHRAGECSRAVDFLERLNGGDSIENALDSTYNAAEFKSHLNTDKLAIMGHSFGGATTILSVIEDARFKVAVGLDAWAFPLKPVPLDQIHKPLLLINAETLGTEKHNVKKISEIFKHVDHDRKQAFTINGSTHMQQCDVPLVYSKVMNSLLSRLDPKKSTIDTLDVHDLTNAKALQFISRHLNIETDDAIEQFLHANKRSFRPSYV